MAKKKSTAKVAQSKSSTPAAPAPGAGNEVDEFMRALDHPLKAEIERVRVLILGVDHGISEGIKWNAPSFRTSEYFATFNIRKDYLQVVLHLGAKARPEGSPELSIGDPTEILEWHAKDRCSVKFRDMDEIADTQRAFAHIVRQWIAYVR